MGFLAEGTYGLYHPCWSNNFRAKHFFMIYPKLRNGHIFDKKDVMSGIALKGHGPYDFD